MAIVRSSGKFPGAGVYTVPELFHRAGEFVTLLFYSIYSNRFIFACFLAYSGLSPFLTEAEVFDSASRTARLCAAFYHFAALAHSEVWYVIAIFL